MESIVKLSLSVAVLFVGFSHALFAQCSDAGICVIGSKHAVLQHQLGASYLYAKGDKKSDLSTHSVQVEVNLQLFENSRLAILFPWSRISGRLGQTNGIGDLSVVWTQGVWGAPGDQLSLHAGGKFATGSANSGDLPQAYQTGLGTNDLLLGASYETEPWLIAFGYQFSRGRSSNAVTRLRRGDDLLARIGYKTAVEDLVVGLEMLAIKRLERSSVLDTATAARGNSFVEVPGSDQFQLDVLMTFSRPISEHVDIRGLVAVPIRNRSVNVDGLTRGLTVSLGLQYSL
jgi:hypothetical protein